MVRKISNQEVAIILSLDDSEEEDALSVVTYVPKDCDLDRDTLDELLNVTTFLTSFLHLAERNQTLRKQVMEYRNALLDMEHLEDMDFIEEEEGLPPVDVKTTNGKVIRLDAWTKTKGNA